MSTFPLVRKALRRLALLLQQGWQALMATLLAFAPAAQAQTPPAPTQLPQGGKVVAGQAAIRVDDATARLQVQQASQRAVIDWTKFNVGEKAEVEFAQTGRDAATLNRVLDSEPSRILGKVTAPGQVFLVNPNGVIFGRTARVDVGGLVASALGMDPARFMMGEGVLERLGATGKVVNEGELKAKLGGYVALLAPEVRNDGVIVAPAGTAALAAGESVTLDLGLGGSLAGVRVTRSQIDALVENRQAVIAPEGLVILSARAAQGLKAQVVQGGSIDASSVVERGGRIWLEGDDIQVKSTAVLDARGATGGGEVLVGGGWQGSGPLAQARTVTAEAGSRIDASATGGGDGGTVVLWSDTKDPASTTTARGEIKARGGEQGGRGGRIETSASSVFIDGLKADAGAARGPGGLWLIDPFDYTIGSTEAASIVASLNASTSVTIDTSVSNGTSSSAPGTINVNSPIAKSTGGEATLTLKAHDNVLVNSAITSGTTANKLNVVLWADSDGNGQGAIRVLNSTVTTNGGHLWAGGGAGAGGWKGLTVGSGSAAQSSSPNFYSAVQIEGSTITTGAGDISMNGSARRTNTSWANGIDIRTNSTLSGANIDLTGTGSTYVTTADWGHVGVQVSDSAVLGTGNVTLTGVGGGRAGDGGGNHGIRVLQANSRLSAGGTLTLDGTGGGGGTARQTHGVLFDTTATNTQLLKAGTGVVINGVKGTSSGDNYGFVDYAPNISVAGSVKVASTGPVWIEGNLQSGSGQDLVIKSTTDIYTKGVRTFDSNGGKLVFWSNSTGGGYDTTGGSGSGILSIDSNNTFNSGGGAIVLAGGADANGLPSGFARNTAYGGNSAGVLLGAPTGAQTTTFDSGGGDITIRGASAYGSTQGILNTSGVVLNAGTGKVTVRGWSNTRQGAYFGGWGTGTTKITAGEVDMLGTATTGAYSGLVFEVPSTIDASTKVTLEGKSAQTGESEYGLHMMSSTGNSITSKGPVLLKGDGVLAQGNLTVTVPGAANGIRLLSRRQVAVRGTSTLTTQGGPVVIAGRSEGGTGFSRLELADGPTITTNGGDITLGGGDAAASDYALGSDTFNAREGLRIAGGITLKSGGGNIVLRGKAGSFSADSAAGQLAHGISQQGTSATATFDAGSGTILLQGDSTRARGSDDYQAAIAFNGPTRFFSSNASATSIKLEGTAIGSDATGGAASAGVALYNADNVLMNTGAGGILVKGSRGGVSSSIEDVYIGGGRLMAGSGTIRVEGTTAGSVLRLGYNNTNTVYLGAVTGYSVDGKSVVASSSNVELIGDGLKDNQGPGKVNVNTTGKFSFVPTGDTFQRDVNTSMLYVNENQAASGARISGFTFGKDQTTTTPTYDFTLSRPLTVAGPVDVRAQKIAVANDLTTFGAAGDVQLKASKNIDVASRSIVTDGGDVTLWSNSFGATTLAGIKLNDNSRIDTRTAADRAAGTHTSGGGAIWLGGGTDLATGYAQQGDLAGVMFGYNSATGSNTGIQLLSGGGHITVRGMATVPWSYNTTTFGVVMKEGVTLNAGTAGNITVVGRAENPNTGQLAFGVDLASAGGGLAQTVFKTVDGSILIDGSTTSTATNSRGIQSNGATYASRVSAIASGGGSVEMRGKSGAGAVDVQIQNTWLQSADGAAAVTAARAGGQVLVPSGPISAGLGQKAGTAITSSTAALTITTDVLTLNAPFEVGSMGMFTLQPWSASFPTALSWPRTNMVVNGALGGLTLGKPGNTADVTVTAPQAIFGPINVYAGTINVQSDMYSVGDIVFKASKDILQSAGTTVSAKSGNVTYWADSDGSGGGRISVDGTAANPAVINTTVGGNITLSGGLGAAAGGIDTTNGRAQSVDANPAIKLDYTNVRAAGDVFARGSTGVAGSGVGVRLRGGSLSGVGIDIQGRADASTATAGGLVGLQIDLGQTVSASGAMTLEGIGGGASSTGAGHVGLLIQNAGTSVSASGASITATKPGDVLLKGTGGAKADSSAIVVQDGASVSASGAGSLTLQGTALATNTASGNHGVLVQGANTSISHSGRGALLVDGTSSKGAAGINTYGVLIQDERGTPDATTSARLSASAGSLTIKGSALPGNAQDAIGVALKGVTVATTGAQAMTVDGRGGTATRSARGIEAVDATLGGADSGLITLKAVAGTGGSASGALLLQRGSVGAAGQAGGITFAARNLAFDTAAAETVGTLTFDGGTAGFATPFVWTGSTTDGNFTGTGNLAGLTVRNWPGLTGLAVTGTAADRITVDHALSVAGLLHLRAGTLQLNQAVGATGSGGRLVLDAMDGTLSAGSAAAVTATQLLLKNIPATTLTHADNAIGTLAGTGLGSVQVASKTDLGVGAVEHAGVSVSGLSGTGAIEVAARDGANLAVVAPVTTTAHGDAIVLEAGAGRAAGDATGGQLMVAAAGVLTTGGSGRALLYTGSVAGTSIDDSIVASGSGRFRYNSNPTTARFSTALATTGASLVYREAVAANVVINPSTSVYQGTPAISHSSTGLVNGDTPDFQYLDAQYSGAGLLRVGGYTVKLGSKLAALGYSVTSVDGHVDVTPKALTVSGFTSGAKVYDGTRDAVITHGGTLAGIEAGDTVEMSHTSATFADKNVGSGKTVTLLGLALSGADAGNYSVDASSATTTADITRRTLTVTPTAAVKTYDGTTSATLGFADDRVAGDVLTIAGSGQFETRQAGTGKIVNVSDIVVGGLDAGNYTAPTSAVTHTSITKRPLAITWSGVDKVYDGGVAAAFTAVDDRILGDVLTVQGSASFDTRHVGSGKAVAITALALTGADAVNYSLDAASAATTASITPRALAPTVAARDKVYDGSTAAQLTITDDRIAGDVLTWAGSGSFADKQVGTAKAVSVAGLTISGADAGNYSVATGTASTQASITPRVLDISMKAANKVYDRTTAASLSIDTDNRVAGDDLTLSASGAFWDANAGRGKAVIVSAPVLGGADAANYTLQLRPYAVADITPRPLAITVTASNKVYDGGTAAVFSIVDDRLAGDVLNLAGIGSFADKHVGSAKTVTLTGVTLTGPDAANYSFTASGHTATADITPRPLTAVYTTASKVYDGTTAASVTAGDNRVAGDAIAFAATAQFADKHVGSAKTVTVTAGALTGPDAANYTMANASATSQGDITPRPLHATITAQDKVYDGTTAAAVNVASDRLAGDAVSIVADARFADKHVGSGKAVTMGTATLSGADAGNYTLSATVAETTASITPRTLNLSLQADSRGYDGGTGATFSVSDDRIVGDLLAVGGRAHFADKHIGTAKPVTIEGIALGGSDARNYVLAGGSTAISSADITARTLVVDIQGQSKVYDGSTAAGVVLRDNRVGGDLITVSADASFADKHVGSGKAVTVSSLALSGADAGNYTLATRSGSTTADITPRPLSVLFQGIDKVYDGGTAATVGTSDNRVAGDMLSIARTATFADKHAGGGKAVSIVGVSLAGADAGNYTVQSSGQASAAITPRPLTLTYSAADKVYDGSTAASVSAADDRIAGDVLAITQSAAFADRHAGTAKSVLVTDIALTGADGANYRAVLQPGTVASITPKPVTLTGASGVSKVYDGALALAPTDVGHGSVDGLVAGDVVTVQGRPLFDSAQAGARSIVRGTVALGGSEAGNYSLTWRDGSGTIERAPLTVRARDDARLIAQPDAAGYNGVAITGFVAGEDASVLGGSASVVRSNAGVGTAGAYESVLVPSGLTSTNYDIRFVNGHYTIVGAGQLLVRAGNASSVYGNAPVFGIQSAQYMDGGNVVHTLAAPSVSGNTFTFDDGLGGSARFTLVPDAASVTASGAGQLPVGRYALRPQDVSSTSGNFSNRLALVGDLTVTTRPLRIDAGGVTKVYDGTTAMTGLTLSANGLLAGDVTTASGSGAFATRHVGSAIGYAVSGLRLAGTDSANYHLEGGDSLAGSDGRITPRALVVGGITALDKVYDGNRSATMDSSAATWSGLVAGDSVSVAATGLFADKRAGIGKVVDVTTLFSGQDAGNYAISAPTTALANITPRPLAIGGLVAQSRVYDGGTLASIDAGAALLHGLVSGDSVVAAGSGRFSDRNAGLGKVVTISPSIGGADADNYVLQGGQTAALADITPRLLAVQFAGIDKVYDGSRSAAFTSLDNRIAGDGLKVVGSASFADKHVGDGKVVSVAGITLEGLDAGNYRVDPNGTARASITPRTLVVDLTPQGKVYDGNVQAAVTSRDDRIAGDALDVVAQAQFADANVGTAKPVTLGSVTLTGPDAGNYRLSVRAATTADITRLAEVTWIGGSTGLWSDPANWAGGAVPSLANVAGVVIPAGVNVIFDASASAPGAVQVDRIGTAGGISQSGGVLHVADSLTLGSLTQTGGTLAGSGSLTITESFAQSGSGRIAMGGNVSLTQQGSTPLSFSNLSGQSVVLIAGTGGIQGGQIDAASLTAQTTGDIRVAGTVTLDGATRLEAGGAVQMTNPANRLQGAVTVEAASAQLASQALQLGNVNVRGDLSAMATNGALTQVAGSSIQVGGASTLVATQNGAPAPVLLNASGNRWGQPPTVIGSRGGAGSGGAAASEVVAADVVRDLAQHLQAAPTLAEALAARPAPGTLLPDVRPTPGLTIAVQTLPVAGRPGRLTVVAIGAPPVGEAWTVELPSDVAQALDALLARMPAEIEPVVQWEGGGLRLAAVDGSTIVAERPQLERKPWRLRFKPRAGGAGGVLVVRAGGEVVLEVEVRSSEGVRAANDADPVSVTQRRAP